MPPTKNSSVITYPSTRDVRDRFSGSRTEKRISINDRVTPDMPNDGVATKIGATAPLKQNQKQTKKPISYADNPSEVYLDEISRIGSRIGANMAELRELVVKLEAEGASQETIEQRMSELLDLRAEMK